jgi:menaquinol-cytochrome c reductase iron-sulfur subunit
MLVGIPALGAAVGPALKQTESGMVPIGRTDSYQEDVPKSAEFSVATRDGWMETTKTVAVWVVKQASGEFVVYNGHCTHLGCAYHWQDDLNQFVCPCHAGVYGKDGRVLAGPPPRPLDPLETSIEDGMLKVKHVDFRLGVSERVPV